jgi:hypothetical protein
VLGFAEFPRSNRAPLAAGVATVLRRLGCRAADRMDFATTVIIPAGIAMTLSFADRIGYRAAGRLEPAPPIKPCGAGHYTGARCILVRAFHGGPSLGW